MTDQGGADSGQSAADADSGQGAAGAGSTDSTGTSGDGTRSGADAEKKPDTVAAADFERLKTQLQAADRKRAEAETQLKAIRDKDLPEAEKLKKDYEETVAENEKIKADLNAVRVQNAFLSDNTHKWRDPKHALSSIDLSKVTVDADGGVTGLKDALAALAKQYPYMLEPAAQDSDDEGKGGKKFTPPGAGAGRPAEGNTGVDTRRFPAIGRRIGPS